ncbi:MAG: hypothetical protein JJV99_02210 [Colwellia sp.]|nr:hypothetical protein [Colwellia sp.]
MFGALTSLTSGGGLTSSSSSSAGHGDSSSGGDFFGGGLNFAPKKDNTVLLIGLAIVVALIYTKK